MRRPETLIDSDTRTPVAIPEGVRQTVRGFERGDVVE